MKKPIDLSKPEEIALLRHSLSAALNEIVGYAGIVREQAREQSAGGAAGLMDRVLDPARQLAEIVRRLLPPKSYVSEADVLRLRANTSARVERIQTALTTFETTTGGACAPEIARIRVAVSELTDFVAGIPQMRPAPGPRPAVFEMPPVSGTDEISGAAGPHQMPRGRGPYEMPRGRGPYEMPPGRGRDQMPPGREPYQMPAGPVVFEMPAASGGEGPIGASAGTMVYEMPAASADEAPSPASRWVHILVVDDDATHQEVLGERLRLEGFTPVYESSGGAALARLQQEEYDLVLLDLEMPEMDGFAVLEAMRSSPGLRRVPVIALCAPHQQESALRAIEMGAADFLAGPFEPVLLRARVGAILQRRQAEAARAAMSGQLRESSRLESAGILAGRVTHDLNNLLTGILGNASLVADALPASDPHHDLMADVVAAGERAADLTRQLLAFTGQGETAIEPVDLSGCIQDVGRLLRSALPKAIQLNLRLAERLPAAQADARQIRQLVFNLVLNAGEAIGEQDGTVTVDTGLRHFPDGGPAEPPFGPIAPGYYGYISVEDTGSGMDAPTRSRIFEPFFSTKSGRRGLGLTTAMGIARAHHGVIHVESEPDQGSRLELLLPVEGKPVELPPIQPESSPGRTILVVDDEEAVRGAVRGLLERKGYQVLVADGGRQAVDLLRERAGDIDLVLLDLTMPGMAGDEAARYLRAIRHDVPILVASGAAEGEAARRLVGRAAGFVTKPYAGNTLLETIASILG